MSLRGQIRRYLVWLMAIAALVIVSIPTGIHILREQRFVPPWKDFYEVDVEVQNASAVVAGQGQKVTIAGVEVGEVDGVRLKDGLGVVRIRVENRYAPIYRDAEVIVRPRTGLKDLEVMLDPGEPRAGKVPDGGSLPATQSGPDTTEEFLTTIFDADARRGFRALVASTGTALSSRGARLRKFLSAAQPTARMSRRLLGSIAGRRRELSRLIHNLNAIARETGRKDDEISDTVTRSARTFEALAGQDAELREATRRLPGTLRAAIDATEEGERLAGELRPTAQALRPVARKLGPALTELRPLLREGTPILRDQIRPLVRRGIPVVRNLGPAAQDLSRMAPALTEGGKDLRHLVNELLYDPPGAQQSYGFYLGWFAHNGASMLSTEDAHGAAWRGQVIFSCSGAQGLSAVSPVAAALIGLPASACSDPDNPTGGLVP